MRYILLVTLTTIICDFILAQSLEVVSPNGNEKLLGQWPVSKLAMNPYNLWFSSNYESYEPDQKTLRRIQKNKNSFDSITVFMGTWCGDSKREVPKLVKLLDQMKVGRERLKVICVDRSFQNYKQSPGREESNQNIHRVPTIIFHSEGNEIGRIVESPESTLEVDLLSIISEEGYTPNYEGVTLLNELFEEKGLSYLKENMVQVAAQLSGIVKNKYELNTYGLVLFSSFQLAEANIVYEYNKLLFPNESLPYFSLGRFEAISGNMDLALADLEKALELDPEDKNVKAYLEKVRRP